MKTLLFNALNKIKADSRAHIVATQILQNSGNTAQVYNTLSKGINIGFFETLGVFFLNYLTTCGTEKEYGLTSHLLQIIMIQRMFNSYFISRLFIL